MKRVIAFIVVFTLPALVLAQQGEFVHFPQPVHDFGMMKQHDRQSHEFKFYNPGSDTVRLSAPKASCGCTAILLSNYNIAPGDSGIINVTFTAVPGSTGPTEKNVYVNNAANPPEKMVTLTVKANVVGEIAIDQTFIRYESMVGETEKIKIHIKSMAEGPIGLDNVSVGLMEYADTTAGPDYNSANTRASPVTWYTLDIPKPHLEPGEETDIILAIPSRDKGQINGSVRIALPNSIVTVGISGVILQPKKQ